MNEENIVLCGIVVESIFNWSNNPFIPPFTLSTGPTGETGEK
ncbi:hypothetical protein [Bacillus mycoides]|nr:hypothetical protein [Bacillus mycoides]